MNESSSPAAGQRKRIQADVVRRRHRRRRCEAGHHDDDDDEMGIIWAVEGRERRSERRTSGFIMRDQAAAAWLVWFVVGSWCSLLRCRDLWMCVRAGSIGDRPNDRPNRAAAAAARRVVDGGASDERKMAAATAAATTTTTSLGP